MEDAIVSTEFWTDFHQNYWGRAPGLFRGLLPAPMLTAEEAFEALVRGAQNQEKFRARIYVEDRQLETGSELLAFFPKAADRTLAGYARRLARLSKGRPYGIIVNDIARHHFGIWSRVRSFLEGLYRVIGLPVSNTDAVLFLGDYGATPGGIHRDFTDTIAFPILKRKRMLIWDDNYFERLKIPTMRTRAAAEPFDHLEDAVDLEMAKSDFMYWPRNHWHVAISDGGLNASFSIGVMHRDLGTQVEGLVRELPGSALRAFPTDALDPPRELFEPIESIGALFSSGRLHREQLLHWLRIRTSGGCLPAPWNYRALKDDDLLEPSVDLWMEQFTDGDELLVAVNGYSFALPKKPGARRLARWLEEGGRKDVRSLIAQVGKGLDAALVRKFLHVLAGASAVKVRSAVKIRPRKKR
jgi:hypothetical protein